MKHIRELVTKNGMQSTDTSIPNSNECTEAWIVALFGKFRAIYGNKWTDQFTSPNDLRLAKEEWGAGLAGTTAEQMRAGIDWCRDNLDWPPSIAQFKNAAKGKTGNWEHASAAYRIVDPRRLLVAKHTDENKEIAGNALGYIFKILGK